MVYTAHEAFNQLRRVLVLGVMKRGIYVSNKGSTSTSFATT